VGQAAGGGPIVVDEVIANAASGDRATLEALASLGRWLGFGLAGLVNLLDPERIALGGLFGRLHPYVAEAIADEFGRRLMTQAREPVAVVPAELGPDAPLIGAAELALASLLDDPSAAPPRGDSPPGPVTNRSKEVARALTA
jgi:predicted NBD/HSP70 family sugar kinase